MSTFQIIIVLGLDLKEWITKVHMNLVLKAREFLSTVVNCKL